MARTRQDGARGETGARGRHGTHRGSNLGCHADGYDWKNQKNGTKPRRDNAIPLTATTKHDNEEAETRYENRRTGTNELKDKPNKADNGGNKLTTRENENKNRTHKKPDKKGTNGYNTDKQEENSKETEESNTKRTITTR